MFADKFKEIRTLKQLKQTEIAQKVSKTKSYVYRIEKGLLNPPINMFVSLCEALQVTYDELKELHLEYEKLIKPQQAKELIIEEFAKSEYIVSLLVEGMHFKNDLMELYRQAYQEGNKFLVYFSFFVNYRYLISAVKYKNKKYADYIKINEFYQAIDIMKEKSKELYELTIKPLSEEEKFKADLLKKCLKEIIDKMENNFIMEDHEIKNLINKQNISDDDKKKLLKVIKLALENLDNPIIDKNLKFIFDIPIIVIYNKGTVPDFFYIYDYIKLFIFNKREGIIFIETIDGQYYNICFKQLYDDVSFIDIMADDFTTALKTKCQELGNILLEINNYITNDDFREKFFKATIDKNLELYKLIRNSFMINNDIYDINKRHREHINILTKENDKLTKHNSELKQEIAKLKKQLDKKGNEEEN